MAEVNDKLENAKIWYRNNLERFTKYNTAMTKLTEEILETENISYQSIFNRVKEEKSYLDKCDKDKYTNPIEQIMDVSGIRVITYTNADVKRICEVIEKEFKTDVNHSGNKADALESDRVGYLSVHYVVELNEKRAAQQELEAFKGMESEIQVRTLLQHAWAEIEHDRNYKFAGELPNELRRRFYLLAGVLEMVDNEFDRLSGDVERYRDQVKNNADNEQLDIPIDSISITAYLEQKYQVASFRNKFVGKDIIKELNAFGIDKLQDFVEILRADLVENMVKHETNLTFTDLIRLAMIIFDSKKYFDTVFGYVGEGFEIGENMVAIAKEYDIEL